MKEIIMSICIVYKYSYNEICFWMEVLIWAQKTEGRIKDHLKQKDWKSCYKMDDLYFNLKNALIEKAFSD